MIIVLERETSSKDTGGRGLGDRGMGLGNFVREHIVVFGFFHVDIIGIIYGV